MNPVLRLEHLNKSFGKGPNRVQAVQDFSLEVNPGEIFGFLGPNGAGKTTTISMICGLLKPDSGEVYLQGKALSRDGAELRSLVGVCPQSIVIWEKLTCLENLEFAGEMYGVARSEARRRGLELLEILGLTEKRNRLAQTLSGGMQRRLNLALALVHQPQLLVLDEPEAGLDPQSRVLVREYIRRWAREEQGRTVIFTTHNMDEAERLVDRVAVIDRGRLLVLDTPEALKHSVGQGDVLEIALHGELSVRESLPAALAVHGLNACLREGLLEVRAMNGVEALSLVLDALRLRGLQAGEVRLRGNTLEDVFLALTGRRLRE